MFLLVQMADTGTNCGKLGVDQSFAADTSRLISDAAKILYLRCL